MAHIDAAPARGGRRGAAATLNLVPYIDLLVTLMAFLMISAAWTSFQAIAAQAASSGGPAVTTETPAREPHRITLREADVIGLEALAALSKETPVVVEVEDSVQHTRVIDVLDAIAARGLGPATVQPVATR